MHVEIGVVRGGSKATIGSRADSRKSAAADLMQVATAKGTGKAEEIWVWNKRTHLQNLSFLASSNVQFTFTPVSGRYNIFTGTPGAELTLGTATLNVAEALKPLAGRHPLYLPILKHGSVVGGITLQAIVSESLGMVDLANEESRRLDIDTIASQTYAGVALIDESSPIQTMSEKGQPESQRIALPAPAGPPKA